MRKVKYPQEVNQFYADWTEFGDADEKKFSAQSTVDLSSF